MAYILALIAWLVGGTLLGVGMGKLTKWAQS